MQRQFIDPPADAVIGERLMVDGFEGLPEAEVNPAKKANPWTACVSLLKTDASKVACFDGKPLRASVCGVACTAPTVAEGLIS